MSIKHSKIDTNGAGVHAKRTLQKGEHFVMYLGNKCDKHAAKNAQ